MFFFQRVSGSVGSRRHGCPASRSSAIGMVSYNIPIRNPTPLITLIFPTRPRVSRRPELLREILPQSPRLSPSLHSRRRAPLQRPGCNSSPWRGCRRGGGGRTCTRRPDGRRARRPRRGRRRRRRGRPRRPRRGCRRGGKSSWSPSMSRRRRPRSPSMSESEGVEGSTSSQTGRSILLRKLDDHHVPMWRKRRIMTWRNRRFRQWRSKAQRGLKVLELASFMKDNDRIIED